MTAERTVTAERRTRGWRAWSLQTRLWLVLGMVLAVLALTVTAVLVSSRSLAAQRARVTEEVDPAAIITRELRAELVPQAALLRSFLLTGDAGTAAVIDQENLDALVLFDELVDTLGGLEALTPELQRTIDELVDAHRRWVVDVLDPTLAGMNPTALNTSGDLDDDVASAHVTMVAALGELERTLDEERAVERAGINAAYSRVLTAVGLQAAVVVLAAALLHLALRRSVVAPIESLAADARRVATGDLRTPVTASGPPETRALGHDVEAMRLRLLAELDRLAEATTELEARRDELAAQAEELARSNRDLEQFAYVASHDLQEPLRKVAGFCQLLERRYKGQLDERADEYIGFAIDGARRMQDLINDLLAFSRVGRTTERFEPVDLSAAVADAQGALSSQLEDSGAEVTVDGPLPVVDGDRRLLTAVFQNLIGNAVKFRREDRPVVHITSLPVDDGWEVRVADNGIGIEPDYAEKVFVLFTRLHRRTDYEGTGIGLALCKRIVEFHGGRIWIDTEAPHPGDAESGTTFCVRLPTHAELTAGASSSETDTPPAEES